MKRRELWICVVLAALTIAAYAQVYRHDFISFDDGDYVYDNWRVLTGFTPENILWAFTTGHAANWHPLTWLSHMLDCQILGREPGPHHLVNVLFHVLNTLLLFELFRFLTGKIWRSAFVAALFALHPLHVESVAWISERKDVLSTFFWLLTMLAYARYVKLPSTPRYLLAVGFFALGLMSKPMLVTLPFVLLLMDYWPLNRGQVLTASGAGKARLQRGHALKTFVPQLPRLAREKLPFFLLAAASSAVTFYVQRAGGAVVHVSDVPPAFRIANALNSYISYLVKTVWPADLSVYYPFPAVPYAFRETAAAAILLVAASVLAVRHGSRFPYLPFGWFWYVGTLIPVIGLVQVGGQAMADRYTYVPLIGIFALLAWAIPDMLERRKIPGVSKAGMGALVIGSLTITTWFQVRNWKDSDSLFQHALKVDGTNFMAHQILGIVEGNRGRHKQALSYYTEALRLRPRFFEATVNLGFTYYELGNSERAYEYYSKALEIRSDHPILLKNMGLLLYREGKYGEAVEFYNRSLHLLPDDLLLRVYWGNAAAKLGREREAIAAYEDVLRKYPEQQEAYLGLGALFLRQGKIQPAIANFEKALEINKEYAEAHTNLGTAYFQLGRVDTAITHYKESIQLEPDDAETRYNYAVALYSQGARDKAVEQYRETIRLDPKYTDAYYNLGIALADAGELQEAVSMYAKAVDLKKDYAEAYHNLGIALFNLGYTPKALEAIAKALEIRPDYREARTNFGLIESTLSRPRKKN